MQNQHYVKYRSFTWFPGVEILRKDSFRIISGESPETMQKLCLSAKFPHQEIRWNYDILQKQINNFSNSISQRYVFSKVTLTSRATSSPVLSESCDYNFIEIFNISVIKIMPQFFLKNFLSSFKEYQSKNSLSLLVLLKNWIIWVGLFEAKNGPKFCYHIFTIKGRPQLFWNKYIFGDLLITEYTLV